MKRATTDTLYFATGPDNAPTMHVEPGEQFEVQTQINRGPWIETHPDSENLKKKLIGGNPSSGCIWVDGAEPGDMLTVEILDIQLDDMGYTQYRGLPAAMHRWCGIEGFGQQSRIVKIVNDKVIWSDDVHLPAKPMVGFVGIAPAHEALHNGRNGDWGGNFDVQEIAPGAKVHLRVQCPGALLHMGDMHAIQGDGEICGAGGIETSGLIRAKVHVTSPKPKAMHWPRIEDDTHIATVGFARPAEDAFRIGLESLAAWLDEEYNIPTPEALMFLGQVLEARCTQFVNPTFSYICKVKRKYLPK